MRSSLCLRSHSRTPFVKDGRLVRSPTPFVTDDRLARSRRHFSRGSELGKHEAATGQQLTKPEKLRGVTSLRRRCEGSRSLVIEETLRPSAKPPKGQMTREVRNYMTNDQAPKPELPARRHAPYGPGTGPKAPRRRHTATTLVPTLHFVVASAIFPGGGPETDPSNSSPIGARWASRIGPRIHGGFPAHSKSAFATAQQRKDDQPRPHYILLRLFCEPVREHSVKRARFGPSV